MYEEKAERDALFSMTGKYTELKLLNDEPSGFGWAILVQDNFENNRLKVIKLPNKEAATRELLVEAEILAKISQYLRHPNLIELGSVECYRIHWNEREEKRWFIVLQFGGSNLRSRMGRLRMRRQEGGDEYVYHGGAALPVDEVFDLALQITDGLRALHEFEEVPGQHIIHRDIKPENILIDEHGRARLTDFGISKVVERLTQSITVAGTPPYLAPEYSRGRITASSDIYSLGIVLYELATGQFPFRRADDKFYTMPQPPATVNPRVPAGLSDVIMQAMYWNPSGGRGEEERQRYQRAAEMLADLRRAFSKLHPVPPQYERLSNDPAFQHAYRDKTSGDEVRIFLYETSHPGQSLSRLAPTVHLQEAHVLAPQRTFETEGMVGVVAPPVRVRPASAAEMPATIVYHMASGLAGLACPPDAAGAGAPGQAAGDPAPGNARIPEGEDAYRIVARTLRLCEQLQSLHRSGIYHGTMTPLNVYWETDHWILDQVWRGALAGLAAPHSVFAEEDVSIGFLAPEMLRWQSPPALSCDIYGLGALLYGTLAGATPMDPLAARAMMTGAPAPPFRAGSAIRDAAPRLPRRLQDIIVKALQPDPADRHRTIDELAADLSLCRWPDDMVQTLIEQAHDCQKQGRLVEAYDLLDEALRLEPGSPDVHHARAEIYFLEGEFKWALKENAKVLAIDPTPSVCFLHGQCLMAMDRFDEAEECLREGLSREDGSRGRHLLAQCLERTGLHQAALSEYEVAARIAELEQNPFQIEQIKSDLSSLLSRIGGS